MKSNGESHNQILSIQKNKDMIVKGSNNTDSNEVKHIVENGIKECCKTESYAVDQTPKLLKDHKQLFDLESYTFKLPNELIAQYPQEKRAEAKLMIVDKKGVIHKETTFESIVDYFQPDDILVFNNSKVIKSRLYCKRISDGRITETVIVEKIDSNRMKMLIRSKKRFFRNDTLVPININSCIHKENYKNTVVKSKLQFFLKNMTQLPVFADILFTIEEIHDDHIIVSCNKALGFQELNQIGSMPIPPYITRLAEQKDDIYYQAVFARHSGSLAAPTAGLHISSELLEKIRAKVSVEFITLHVGWGTFSPIRVSNIKNHTMHAEHYEISQKTVDAIELARKRKGRIIACGTTTLRALEGNFLANGMLSCGEYTTDIFIYPGYKFNIVDSLITNFHTPKSSLLVLVSAFAGFSNIMKYYEHAVYNNYKFFSYGDGMLIL